MAKFKMYNNELIDKEFFESTLSEFKKEKWELTDISDLGHDHVNCDLTMKTISEKTDTHFYRSNNFNIISVEAFNHYIKDN